MTDQQQPTQEALSVDELWRDLLEKDDRTSPEEYPDHALITFGEFKYCLESFAAQRVTAAESEIETRFWSIVDQDGLCGVPSDMWNALSRLVMRTAATDKARREARDACAEILERRARGFASGGHCDAIFNGRIVADELNANARRVRALTPQNPGDAAPESE